MINDLMSRLTITGLLNNQSLAATTTSTAVAIPDFIGTVMALLDVGAVVGGTSPTLNVVVKTCATQGGTYQTVATFNQVTSAAGRQAIILNETLLLSWVEIVVTIAGSPTGYPISVSLIGQIQYT